MKPARGISLVEVVAALVLTATTLTTLLLVLARTVEQAHVLQHQEKVTACASSLVAAWSQEPPEATEGICSTDAALTWRRSQAIRHRVEAADLFEVTLTIVDRTDAQREQTLLAYTWLERPPEESD